MLLSIQLSQYAMKELNHCFLNLQIQEFGLRQLVAVWEWFCCYAAILSSVSTDFYINIISALQVILTKGTLQS